MIVSIFSFNIPLVDIILILVLLYGGYKGYQKGLVMELLSIAILIGTIWLLFFFVTNGITGLQGLIGTKFHHGMNFFIFFLVYVFIIIFLNKIGRFLQSKIDYSILDDFDNLAAAAVSVFKYAVFLSVLVTLLKYIGLDLPPEALENSVVYSKLLSFQAWMIKTASHIFPSIAETDREIKQLFSKS